MSKDNVDGKNLRNGMILNLEIQIQAVLEGIGEIRGEIKSLSKLQERFDNHLKDHKENSDIMGGLPYLRKIGKTHWRFIFIAFLICQLAMAFLILKYGIEKIF